jgi:uncharacterized protein YjbI with pentapeptide repeats
MKTLNISDEAYKNLKDQIEAEEAKVKEKIEKKIHIKNRLGEIIYSSSKTTFKEAVIEAVNSGSNLRDSDLSGSDLSDSDLRDSDLSGSDLSCSNLSGSNLRGSDLSGSNLRDSDLSDSDLRDSDLSGSDLSGSNLRDSDLSGSNLRGSDLSGIELQHCKFYGKGGSGKIRQSQVKDFLLGLGFNIVD